MEADDLNTEGLEEEVVRLAQLGTAKAVQAGSEVDDKYRTRLRSLLALVPDDFRLDSRTQWRGVGGRISNVPIREAYQQAKHVIRSDTGLFPDADTFVADVIVNDMCDRKCTAYKPHAARSATGDAVVTLMVEGPAAIRRLLAYIDELEGRSEPARLD